MTRHSIGLVTLLLIISIGGLTGRQEETKSDLLKRLNAESRANLAAKIRSEDDLKRFQLDLLKKRNSQCVTNEELENFGENFETLAWTDNIGGEKTFNNIIAI